MNLSEAAVYLKCGYRIKRTGNVSTILKADLKDGEITCQFEPGGYQPFNPNLNDLLANDWELIL